MAHQPSPMISIPKKSTDDVDWTGPIRNLIAQSYGESPDNYATECSSLQRCRQDAVKGAGSEMTARDLLYKYFGQLELLELRFAEIRVTFPWHDAFTNKLTTQTSLAFEKASIIFQIGATHSAIGASQNRSDPEGLKRAFYYFKAAAGMLTYINDNFLHAPSTDMSSDVVKFLVGIMMAQATEVFFEKCVDEKKSNALVAKVASQASSLYTQLNEEVKEFMGKGIFDRNWVTILQIKCKYFASVTQLYRALADNAAGKHGDALSRITHAESNAKEASRQAASFGAMFMTQMSPNLPPDAGSSIADLTKVHLSLCTEKKTEFQRDNDLIYHDMVPSFDTLPHVDKLVVATPITIQEIYSSPDVHKTIGADIFIKLVPLSVHESASVYSEEKAKLVRGEVERADTADGEVRSALDALGVKEGLGRYKAMVEGLGGEDEVPKDVQRMKEDIELVERQEPVENLLAELHRIKAAVQQELDSIQRDLEIESRACEAMRVKHEHLWTQQPSAGLTKTIRQELKSHFTALEAASASDQQVETIWSAVRPEIQLLLSPQVEDIFRQSAEEGGGASLLDIDPGNEDRNEQEQGKIIQFVDDIEERLGRLNKIASERKQVLKDLKDKIQTDDVSHLLLLHRKSATAEPTLFANELEKFKPYQSRLAATVHHEQVALQEITTLWKGLKDFAGRGPGARKWDEREKRKKDTMSRFSRARDRYMEVRDGLAKGLQFYNDLNDLGATLRKNVKSFVTSRTTEREKLAAQCETRNRLSQPSAPPPLAEKPRLPPPPPPSSFESQFASMNVNGPPSAPPRPPSMQSQTPYLPSPPASTPPSKYASPPQPPPPPPPSMADPYANMFGTSGLSNQFQLPSAPQYQPQQQQQQFGSAGSPMAPPPPQSDLSQLSPQQRQLYLMQQAQMPRTSNSFGTGNNQNMQSQPPPSQAPSAFPPPPPPVSYQSQPGFGAPSPPAQFNGYTGFQYGQQQQPTQNSYGFQR